MGKRGVRHMGEMGTQATSPTVRAAAEGDPHRTRLRAGSGVRHRAHAGADAPLQADESRLPDENRLQAHLSESCPSEFRQEAPLEPLDCCEEEPRVTRRRAHRLLVVCAPSPYRLLVVCAPSPSLDLCEKEPRATRAHRLLVVCAPSPSTSQRALGADLSGGR